MRLVDRAGDLPHRARNAVHAGADSVRRLSGPRSDRGDGTTHRRLDPRLHHLLRPAVPAVHATRRAGHVRQHVPGAPGRERHERVRRVERQRLLPRRLGRHHRPEPVRDRLVRRRLRADPGLHRRIARQVPVGGARRRRAGQALRARQVAYPVRSVDRRRRSLVHPRTRRLRGGAHLDRAPPGRRHGGIDLCRRPVVGRLTDPGRWRHRHPELRALRTPERLRQRMGAQPGSAGQPTAEWAGVSPCSDPVAHTAADGGRSRAASRDAGRRPPVGRRSEHLHPVGCGRSVLVGLGRRRRGVAPDRAGSQPTPAGWTISDRGRSGSGDGVRGGVP